MAIINIEHWTLEAACNGADPNLFFPTNIDDTRPAITLCNDCPVRQECLDYALDNNIKFGIWGGMGQNARRRLHATG